MDSNTSKQKFIGFPPLMTDYWSFPKILDNYFHILNGSEQKVLIFILRHTWGFKKTSDNISLTQLQNGVKNLDKGTGLSRKTITKSLKSLVEKGFIQKSRGKKANNYKLVENIHYSSEKFTPTVSGDNPHTINNNTINNKQYSFLSNKDKIIAYENGKRWEEKPYFRSYEMRWSNNKWWVIEEGQWKEFNDLYLNEIEWK
ncbi:MAG: replication protein [Candidatus Pacebacteria bacterium]|nr:replication protein [Candidatus Paceibacterota bacterium]